MRTFIYISIALHALTIALIFAIVADNAKQKYINESFFHVIEKRGLLGE